MASNSTASRSCGKSVKVLVANKKVMETESGWNKLECPVLKGADGVYFIDDADSFAEIVSKMGAICKKPISRMYYIDSDSDEVPIDSEVEMKEALKVIGERTDKGKFTAMKIESELTKTTKKKEKTKAQKKVFDKMTTKLKEPAPKRPTPNLVAPFRDILREEVKTKTFKAEIAKLKTELSQVWLEKHLHQIKLEIMADVEAILEPYIAEQKKISSLIASLCLEDAAVPPVNIMKHPESDHNYSASCGLERKQQLKIHEKKSDLEEAGQQIYEIVSYKDDPKEEFIDESYGHCLLHAHGANASGGVCTCQYFNEDHNDIFDDDDNLSILSGEISVTDSESDVEGGVDDFVDVPLPSCFNVVTPEEGNASSKPEKEVFRSGKCTKSIKSESSGSTKEEAKKTKSKTNTDQIVSTFKKFDSKKESRRKGNAKQNYSAPIQQRMAAMKKENPLPIGNSEENMDETYNKQQTHVHDGDRGNFEDDEFDNNFDDFIEDSSEKDNMAFATPIAYHDQSDEQTDLPTTQDQLEEKEALSVDGSQKFPYMIDGVLCPPYGQQCNSSTMSHTASQLAPNETPWNKALPRGVFTRLKTRAQTQQPMPASSQKPVIQPPQQLQTQAGGQLQNLTPASLVTQHQQIVQAARRAASQAQHIQALALNPHLKQKQSWCDNPETSRTVGSENSASYHPIQRANIIRNCRSQAALCNIQDTPQEIKLWNEVDAIDIELRKWVRMCQHLMNQVPRYVEEASPYTKGSLKKMLKMAAKTHEDLQKVYFKFRRDVQLVLKQIDAQKLQKQQQLAAGQRAEWTEDPFLILPDKLMQVISSTLNTTFNILGNISKIRVLNYCSSESSNSSSVMEKPQPQVSAAIERSDPQVYAAAAPQNNTRAIYAPQGPPYGFYAYPYFSCTPKTASEVVGNREPAVAYQMYPLMWGQNATSHASTQNSQQQQPPQAQLQSQAQGPLPLQIPTQTQSHVQRQMQQPLQPTQLQQSIQALLQHAHARLQQAPGMQPPARQLDVSVRQMVDSRIETTYNGIPVHPVPVNASETRNVNMSPYGPNSKPSSGVFARLKK
ncbi:hypothetical protein ONE63_009877 [Megalurothrips usitatus]|uniref:Uncharacterized protein n=1 Tax=Megalurothrips usitatus TaxID=439358 RepID=A0AAV7XML0_9NEOP|nr:hypothetical protein ONE63_009877 [Megalurothrips usitatus]